MLYVGIDQHTRQLTVCVRNEEGEVVLRRQVGTRLDKVVPFLEQIRDDAGADCIRRSDNKAGGGEWRAARFHSA
ncbi:MAG: hypothetical protein O3B68_20800, partial [Planctomycetota bacterium]|nr:hypothetical protein [Planctomycetota bacterium]